MSLVSELHEAATSIRNAMSKGGLFEPNASLLDHAGRVVAAASALNDALCAIIYDATGDVTRPSKRLWPIRPAHHRRAREALARYAAAASALSADEYQGEGIGTDHEVGPQGGCCGHPNEGSM